MFITIFFLALFAFCGGLLAMILGYVEGDRVLFYCGLLLLVAVAFVLALHP